MTKGPTRLNFFEEEKNIYKVNFKSSLSVEKVFDAYWRYAYGPNRDAGPTDPRVTEETAIAYLQTALWYAKKKELDPIFYAPVVIPNPAGDFLVNTLDANGEGLDEWARVRAHAPECSAASGTYAPTVPAGTYVK